MKKKDDTTRNERSEAPSMEPMPSDEKDTVETPDQEAPAAPEGPSQEEWADALAQAVKERDQARDSFLRAQADFANFKRRNVATRTEAYDDGARETLFAILPAIDNLEMAIQHAEQQGDNGPLSEGIRMTHKLLIETLQKLGLEEVPALHETFDPEIHNAVMRGPGGEPNEVIEVFQKGYRVKGRMIRYAMVKVSSGEGE